jgi:hypothetical protein
MWGGTSAGTPGHGSVAAVLLAGSAPRALKARD